MLGVIDAGSVGPFRPRHDAAVDGLLEIAVTLNVEVVPDCAPEAVEVIDRSLMEFGMTGKGQVSGLLQLRHEFRHLRIRDKSADGVQSSLPSSITSSL